MNIYKIFNSISLLFECLVPIDVAYGASWQLLYSFEASKRLCVRSVHTLRNSPFLRKYNNTSIFLSKLDFSFSEYFDMKEFNCC